MPSTVNGIGTHYYGKKNYSVRSGVCARCQRAGQLQSYDTRLWVVVFFVPIIPLGRKRIIDYCPACTGHRAAPAGQFEAARQLETSAALDRFRREPTPDTALQAHALLLAFSEHEQAAKFRRAALEQFPDNADLNVGLAIQLEQVLAFADAFELFEAAHRLQPDLLEARVGLAQQKMLNGELDQARQLLDFLEAPGAGRQYSLGPLDQLAMRYQQAGRHEVALELAAVLLREAPDAGHMYEFRKFVQKSEKHLRRQPSILPPQKHSLRGLFTSSGSSYAPWQRGVAAGGAFAAVLLAGLAANNEYTRRHRTLHVVNALGQPVQVQLDGQPPVTVDGLQQLAVGEGVHRVEVTGAVEETHAVTIETGYFDRWFSQPVWVLNPGGAAVLAEWTLFYGQAPQPSTRRLIVAEPLVHRPHIDYRFEPRPDSLEVKNKNQVVQKSRLEWLQADSIDVFQEVVQYDPQSARAYAEGQLGRKPDDPTLLQYYGSLAGQPEDQSGIEKFLKSGLDRRPLSIEWHRTYQQVAQIGGREQQVLAEYDALLAADPHNAGLLYLRGRIEPDWEREEELLQQSAAADSNLPWPYFAMGARQAAAAHWSEAVASFDKARELGLPAEMVEKQRHPARIGAGQVEALADEYRQRLANNSADIVARVRLAEVLAMTGNDDAADQEVAASLALLPGEVQAQAKPLLDAMISYRRGELDKCIEACGQVPAAGPRPSLMVDQVLVHAWLASGQVDEAVGRHPPTDASQDPWLALAISLALDLNGRRDEARAYRERACQDLSGGGKGQRRAAAVLSADDPPSIQDVRQIMIDAHEKTLLLAVLGRRFPAMRDEWFAEARRYNIRRFPPYHLVQRATAVAAEAP